MGNLPRVVLQKQGILSDNYHLLSTGNVLSAVEVNKTWCLPEEAYNPTQAWRVPWVMMQTQGGSRNLAEAIG